MMLFEPKTTIVIVIGIALIVLTVWIVSATLQTKRLIRVGVGIAEKAEAYEQHPQNPTKRILVLGDSSGLGVGAATPEESVAGRMGRVYPNADITNIAVNGARVIDIPGQMESDRVRGQHFDVIILHVGGNDVVRRTPLPQVEQQLPGVLRALRERGDRVILVHGGSLGTAKLLPVGTRWLFDLRTKHLRSMYQRIVPEISGVVYADIIGYMNDNGGDVFASDPATFYAADMFHPGSEGYATWAKVIIPLVGKE